MPKQAFLDRLASGGVETATYDSRITPAAPLSIYNSRPKVTHIPHKDLSHPYGMKLNPRHRPTKTQIAVFLAITTLSHPDFARPLLRSGAESYLSNDSGVNYGQ